MLVLQRNINEQIVLKTSDGPITITLTHIRSLSTARLGIDAPKCVTILRAELRDCTEPPTKGTPDEHPTH